ncbi:MAG: hypothetical protein PHZ00_07070 [Candidatus Peribacteraceae bacterium]|nr:hypothetical protein [Candidatus Peribacteraceae bacterium]
MLDDSHIRIFIRELWKWFAVNKRTLPWRDLTEKDPDKRAYLILVSEIMLQQTQVLRVMVKYKEFVQIFPSLQDLAKASNAEVLIAWKGMGYNSRALRLRDAAKTIVDRFSGQFPTDMESLLSIKGIGDYTAGAIRNFAFNIPTPCIDTNIRRILHRFFVGPENVDGTWEKGDRELIGIAGKVLEAAIGSGKGNRGIRGVRRIRGSNASVCSSGSSVSSVSSESSSSWHAALMDYGSLVMTKANPKWELLSSELRSICKAYGKVKAGTKKVNKSEPGIDLDGRFIPRRIIRGKVVEALRGADGWIAIDEVVRKIGFESVNDQQWFDELLKGLRRDGLIEIRASKIRLAR